MQEPHDLTALQARLGVSFVNSNILLQALTHRSYLNENPDFELDHNERLEFLGDAVLELIVTDHLYRTYKLPEGEMTNLRSAVVRGEMLSSVAREMGLEEYLLMSRGESKDTGKARNYILANAVEAVIGAIYEDQGYDATKTVVDTFITSKLPEVVEKGLHIDTKSKFQELAQDHYRITPVYKVMRESGLDHAKEFIVGVYLHDKNMGEGRGSSKQEAQQHAAAIALAELMRTIESKTI
ncbi:MAG: ribonuclease III [Candidatus Andersenbacteria bacterium RIFCSPHIGHO2_01_FULL_46_36]|uniref:Ribonuclease 3 n=1 Tax=Candidatus Andersenbacteria bacterium RIFCSPHIGHO2_12_FULL_45_11 TaxID=1797281 RepID=A0A1G1X692_9BACT|nr:MAG: ribonuclease III [Candidatus Andersenbacteria bacterium RIFCSPHIGHO2_01_FULL_46_36]OGY35301.1 MAG: ribonuclease III [Candidatus Andersenbacteria bacterium RIFCSPHIGHO2_12_FULL_45_11]